MSHVDEAQVSAYVDADASLTDSERQVIEAHVSSCEACRDLIENARETRDVARSILSRSGPESIPAPAFEDLVAISQQRAAKRPPSRFAWTRGLAAAAVLVLAVSVGIFNRKNIPVLNNEGPEGPPALTDSAVRTFRDDLEAAQVQAAGNRATEAVRTGVTAGPTTDELASVSGAPSRTGAAQPPVPEPAAPLQRRAVTAEFREDDAADAGALAGGRVAAPAEEAELGEGVAAPVAAPPPALAADQPERFEAARSLAETAAERVEVTAQRERAARGELADAGDCRTTEAVLQAIPVVLDCAPLQGFDRDTIDATEVIRVTQAADGRDVWLAMVLDSLVTPELTARITDAMNENRSNATGVTRAGAANQTPNTISVTVGSYRVWLAGNISEEELERLATTLITTN